MKVLFDNNVPAPLRHRLRGHTVNTAREMDWHLLRNGDLLTAAEQGGFQVMVTGDKNLSYQQNLTKRTIAIVVLPTIDWPSLRGDAKVIQAVEAAVDRAAVGSYEQLSESTLHPSRKALVLFNVPTPVHGPSAGHVAAWIAQVLPVAVALPH